MKSRLIALVLDKKYKFKNYFRNNFDTDKRFIYEVKDCLISPHHFRPDFSGASWYGLLL